MLDKLNQNNWKPLSLFNSLDLLASFKKNCIEFSRIVFFCLFCCCLVSPIKLTSFLLSWKRNLITSFQLWKKLAQVWNHSDRSWSFHFVEHPTPDVDMVSKIECIRSFVSIFFLVFYFYFPLLFQFYVI